MLEKIPPTETKASTHHQVKAKRIQELVAGRTTKRLDNLKLTLADVIAAIQTQNVQAPVGRIGARPISNDQQFQMNIQTLGRLATPDQFGNIVLRANPDGSLLRVRDVARDFLELLR